MSRFRPRASVHMPPEVTINIIEEGNPDPGDCDPTFVAEEGLNIQESNLRVSIPDYTDSIAIADAYQRLTTVLPESLSLADAFPFAEVRSRALDSLAMDEARLALNFILAETLGVQEARLQIHLGRNDAGQAVPGFRDTLGIADSFPNVEVRPRVADSVGIRESRLMFTLTLLASKDEDVNKPPACAGAAANDGGTKTTLDCDPLLASPFEPYIGWSVNNLPSNMTVVSIAGDTAVTLNQTAAPSVGASVTPLTLDAAGEVWTETGITCANAPTAAFSNFGAFNTGGTGTKTANWTSGGLNYLQDRITNGTSFSMRIIPPGSQVGTATFTSRQGSSSTGPRLSFRVILNSVT